MWCFECIGGKRCPIVDTWWQTETGAIMITPLPGALPAKPGSATRPLPGIEAEVVDKQGQPVGVNQGGLLVIKRPWPSMLRTIYGDDERYRQAYWSQIKGAYFTADGARQDEDGDIWGMGRVDDVLNVSGHRLSTMEGESAPVPHPKVAAAAAAGHRRRPRGDAGHDDAGGLQRARQTPRAGRGVTGLAVGLSHVAGGEVPHDGRRAAGRRVGVGWEGRRRDPAGVVRNRRS